LSRESASYEDEVCSDSQYDVPWDYTDAKGAMPSQKSVGVVPLWDGIWPSTASVLYPPYTYELENTLPGMFTSNMYVMFLFVYVMNIH
jgi:hypothetical protein